MVSRCVHQTLEEISERWADPRTLALLVQDLTICPCCLGPAKVVIPVWGVNCSRCR